MQVNDVMILSAVGHNSIYLASLQLHALLYGVEMRIQQSFYSLLLELKLAVSHTSMARDLNIKV
jgi:hypothetical protein